MSTGRASGTKVVRLGQSVDRLLTQVLKNRWVHLFLLHTICLSSTSRGSSKWPWLATSDGHHLGLKAGRFRSADDRLLDRGTRSDVPTAKYELSEHGGNSSACPAVLHPTSIVSLLQVMLHIAAGVLASIVMKTLACRRADVFVFFCPEQGQPGRCGLADMSRGIFSP